MFRPPTKMSFAPAHSKLTLLVLILVLPVLSTPVASAAETPKKVLIFSGTDPNLPTVILMNQILRSTLEKGWSGRIQFYSEALDNHRIPAEKYEQEMVKLLQRKYEGENFDLILTLGSAGLKFLLKHKDELFSQTPKIFINTNEHENDGLDLGQNVTGVQGRIELKPALDLALSLHPGTRRVVVVTGSSNQDKFWETLAHKEFRSYEESVEFTYLTNLTIEELRRELASQPQHTIVFFLLFLTDRAGNGYSLQESVSLAAPSSSAPVYVAIQSGFTQGVVGGHMISYEALGKAGAELGLRVLAGESPQNIPPQTVASVAMFDWRELRRWGISESKLPPGSIVRFRELSVWEQYKWHIVGVVSLLILEALLIVGLLINLSRRRQAEKDNKRLARLAEVEQQRLDEVISNVPGIVWESRAVQGTNHQLFSFVSEHVEKMLGYSVEEWLSTPGFAMTIVVEEDRERVMRESRAILESGKDGVLQFRWMSKDGRIVWVESQVAVINDEAGKPIGLRGVTMDVTERKRAELEALQQRKELAHLSRVTMLGELSGSLAHELNQPLGAILRNTEAADLFLRDPLPDLDELRAILADIRKDDQRAGAVIDRMRSMLKRREVEYSLVDLNMLVSEVISFVRSDADSRRVRLALEAASLLPPVSGDRVQLQQVLLNLLLNAMDAVNDSAPDRRLVNVRVQPAGTRVEVVVSDTGHGIPLDKLAHLFEPFFTTKPNGMGMGLPISRMIMQAHGGSIRAENDPGVGATFYLTLPLAKQENAS